MSLFLEEWVRTRLGATFDFSSVGNEFFDGKLFFKILQSYDVVGSEVKQYFCRAQTPEEALKNLNLLRVTFKLLGVLRDDDVLEEIAKKDGTACVDLLNRLYLRLSNKHVLPIVTKGKEMQILRQETGRFNISKVLEKKCQLPPSKRPEEKLLSRLKTSVKVFEKDADRVYSPESVKELGSKSKLVKALNKVKDEVEINFKECKCGAAVEEYLNVFDEKMERFTGGGDATRTVCPPDEYVKMLKLRTLKQAADREIEAKLRDIIVKNIWCKQMQKREEEFRCSLAEKLSKQSTYERDMVQRLGLIQLQYRHMVDKRRQIHEEAQRIYSERLETIVWREDSLTDLDKEREKIRLQDLHRKLFDEKLSRIRQERTDMISDILYDIIDFSIKISRFESENSVKVSPRDLKVWKTLFFKSIPLLPITQEVSYDYMVSESVSDNSFDEYVSKQELIDEVLDDYAVDQYLLLLGPWIKELWPDLEDVEEEMEVLGFAVHRLLEFKYPLPQPPEPADIPLYPIRVVLNNIHDVKAIKTLKALLEKPNVEVIELHTLIKSCVAQYKKEMGLDEKPKKKKDSKTADTQKKGKKKINDDLPTFISVEVQYPSVTEVEHGLSKFAELGKMAYENLGSGLAISDELSSDILIEYLRNMTELEGWVLLNYPADCRQVHYLELKLTGLEPSIRCQILNEKTEVENGGGLGLENDSLDELVMHESFGYEDGSIESESMDDLKLKALRTSRLLPRPNPAVPPIVFHSYFSNFIHLEHSSGLTEEPRKSKQETPEEMNEENMSKESLLEDQTPKSFYEDTDIYIHFPYSKMDFTTLKQLARTVIGESDEIGLERKTSLELFGDIAKEKPKNASSKKTSVSKTKLLKRSSQHLIEEENLIQANEDVEKSVPSTVESVLCLVGEPCWEYTTLSIPGDCQIALASYWESVELTYIQNLKDIFSFYREHDESVVPYRNMVFRKLTTIMETPDERQDLVNAFVSELNSINDILRSHGEMKKEMFCKIFELQLKLWELCDSKKVLCETERQNIINENWLSKHLCELFNIYVTMIETELDRFNDSLQILQDYYSCSFGKAPSPLRPEKCFLPRFKISDFDIGNDNDSKSESVKDLQLSESRISGGKSIVSKRSIDIVLSTNSLAETYAEILSNPEYDRSFAEPFTENMNELLSRTINDMSYTMSKQLSAVEKEKKLLLPPVKLSKSRAATTVKRKHSTSSMSNTNNENSLHDETVLKKESFQRALLEWAKAIQNEKDRTEFRLQLIKNRFINDLFELLDLMTETFHGLHNEISTRYFLQTRNCDNLLRVLMASVEAESSIQAKLILTLEKFQVELENGSLSSAPPPPVTPIEETDEEFTFTVQQLTKFGEKMILVSPHGITVESLITIIEDMVLVGKENGYPYLPKGWSQLTRNEIRKIIKGVFGDIVMADWKDFLVFGLEFRFPTIQEIIETRDKFVVLDPQRTETVNRADFNSVQLWFERDLCDTLGGDLRIVLGKEFLFDLYKTDNNTMNYTAFLLNFCKDENPINGFGKALALATGIGYILSEEELYLIATESEKVESSEMADEMVDFLLQDTLAKAGEITICEVDDNGNPINSSNEEFVVHDYGFFYAENLLKATANAPQTVTGSATNPKKKTLGGDKSKISSPKERPEESSFTKSLSTNSSELKLDSSSSTSSISGDQQDSEIVWKSWLPRQLVLSLLLTSFLYYALPENLFYIQTEVEDGINSLYTEKGVRDCIQGHELAKNQFIKDLFSKCFKFKSCNLTQLVKSIIKSNKVTSTMSTLSLQ